MPEDDSAAPPLICENSTRGVELNGRMETRSAGSRQQAAGSRQQAAGSRSVLFAARSASALYRLLDVLPVFDGDHRVRRYFTLIPGSHFDADALAAVERLGARTLPWADALESSFTLVIAASPKGDLGLLRGQRVLLPHGAGFNKAVRAEGTPELASGLDPAYLLPDGRPLADLHALAHPSQVSRLAALSPTAAGRARVVGDPTLERMLGSIPQRERYRSALGTAGRQLVVLTSTWGPCSLLRCRPGLAAELATQLPYDAYQLALVVHPNEYAVLGEFELRELLAPALRAGAVLAGPCEEWASLLIAADAVVTDHGSTALYAAALGRRVIAATRGEKELIDGSPMAELLAQGPLLRDAGHLTELLESSARLSANAASAEAAFAGRGRVLVRLREELYRRLGLCAPKAPPMVRLLPEPRPAVQLPATFAVSTRPRPQGIEVLRFPAHAEVSAHHHAAEHDRANARQLSGAAVVYTRTGPAPRGAAHSSWTAAGWVAEMLDAYPHCRMAAVVLGADRAVVRGRVGELLTVCVEARESGGRRTLPDMAAVLSGVYPSLMKGELTPGLAMCCGVGGHDYRVRVGLASTTDAGTLVLSST